MIFGLWPLSLGLQAQNRVYFTDTSMLDQPVPVLAVKWIASQQFAHFPAHMVAVEHRLAGKLQIEHGLGLVFARDFADDDPVYFNDKGGFKSFTKAKFYLNRMKPFAFYTGIEVFFNHFTFERTRTFERPCGTDCSFFERRTYDVKNSELGFRVNAGLNSSITNRLYLEAEVGVGMRNNNLVSNNRPIDFLRFYGRIHPEEERVGNYAFNLNLKLAYVLK